MGKLPKEKSAGKNGKTGERAKEQEKGSTDSFQNYDLSQGWYLRK